MEEKITFIECGSKDKCPDGQEHDYSEFECRKNEYGGVGGTVVCFKCGHAAIEDAYWYP